MTETEFRVKHSKLIEYYQLIEMRLKSLCSVVLAENAADWYKGLNDFADDSFGCLLHKLREIQEQEQVYPLTKQDFSNLDELRTRRNYWAHQCFGGDKPIVFKNGEVRRTEYAKQLIRDLNDAIEWDDRLTEINRPMIRSKVLGENRDGK